MNRLHVKRFCLLLVTIAMLQTAGAQEIKYATGTWNEAVAAAQKENKLIFVDVYAVWCGPCKAMDKKVLSQAAVAKEFNAKFINYRMDIEQGNGPQIAQQFGIQLIPTYLFISPQGKLVHRTDGMQSVREFLAEANTAQRKFGQH